MKRWTNNSDLTGPSVYGGPNWKPGVSNSMRYVKKRRTGFSLNTC